ncbi:MAG: RIP metalloprotease RseP [Nevskiaceae bacterium]
MLEVAWSIAAFIVALGVLVSFHEFGHFWVARRLGVKVLRFSVGFGRALWLRRGADGVEYVIAAVPLGGYVKMLDEREGEVAPVEAHRAFNRQNVWKRIAIVAAGPLANFLMAVVAYWIVFVVGIAGYRPLVGQPPAGSIAAQAGLQRGDEVVSINGEPAPTFGALRTVVIDRALAGETLELAARRDGATRAVTLPLGAARLDPEHLFEDLGIRQYWPAGPLMVVRVEPGTSAEQAGLKAGDRVLRQNGVALDDLDQWRDWIAARAGQVVEFEVERGGEATRLTAILSAREHDGRRIGYLGAAVRVDVPPAIWENLGTKHRLSVWAALPAAAAETARMSLLTLKFLYRMVLGDVSVKNISGPIQIAQFAGYTASSGLVSFLFFIAIMSVSLAVLNLLPVPVLDGGHLLYYVVELVKGSPLSDRAQAVGQQVGLTLLVALMGLAFYNDILRLID